ncbi:MAG: hypothetical protein AAB481_05020 [Patescibacteria group bacterium]
MSSLLEAGNVLPSMILTIIYWEIVQSWNLGGIIGVSLFNVAVWKTAQ